MTELLSSQPLPGVFTSFNAIEELYDCYGRQAYGLALRVLEDSGAAEEAVQEIFVRYWRQPGLYNPQKGPFLTWLLREVHCKCLDLVRVNPDLATTARLASGSLPPEILFNKPATAQETEVARRQEQVRQALAGLPQEQRAIVEMAYFKGLNHRQIVQATGQSAQTVRQNLTLGLLRLKQGMS